MARITFAVCLLALCAGAAYAQTTSYVEVFIKWDNNMKQTQDNDKAIREEIAKELCKVPFANVVTLKTLDKSSTLNTESHGYYACTAADSNAVGKALTNCNDSGRRREFKDELEDRTTPDHEAEAITCTLKNGPVPKAQAAGRRLMA